MSYYVCITHILYRSQWRKFPDPDATEGEYPIGREFTNADCAVMPLLTSIGIVAKTDLGKLEPGMGKKLGDMLAGSLVTRPVYEASRR